jgi:CMP-N-acetylneuraminic acid synthetase
MAHIIAYVPMRSGSSRIRDKNISVFAGRRLFNPIIDTLLSTVVDEVVVSSDSDHYLELVSSDYANDSRLTLVKRGLQASSATASTEQGMLEYFESCDPGRYSNSVLVLVQITCPLTDPNDLTKGISKFIEIGRIGSVVSAVESYRFNLLDIGTLMRRPRSQDKTPQLFEAGCFWICNVGDFVRFRNRIISPVVPLFVQPYSDLDIDYPIDLEIAERLYAARGS